MASSGEELMQFLRGNPTAVGRELEFATAYAELMVGELRATVAEWEATVVLLRRMRCRGSAGVNIPGSDDGDGTPCRHGRG
jgi:hypothetical protein